MPRKIKGIRRHGAGWQTYCRVNGEFRCETWPLDTPIADMTAWLREQRAQSTRSTSAPRGTFEADATRYLAQVTALVSYRDRVNDITRWVELFRGRRRRTITSAEIRGQRDAWLTAGVAGSTVNHRLYALSNLWTVLDGRRAPNPVREVPDAPVADPEPRAVPYSLVRRILAALPDRGYTPVRGQRIPDSSKTKARLRVMAWTGLTNVELKHLQPRDWDDVAGTLFVRSRRKGRQGGVSRVIPIGAEARAALLAFDRADAWGHFDQSGVYMAFKRACAKIAAAPETTDAQRRILAELRPYDIRHSHATELYRVSGDSHAASIVLGHRSRKTIERYINGAVAERVTKAMQAFEQATAEPTRERRRGRKVPLKRASRRKTRRSSSERGRNRAE
jgi:site-specific recombinase XerD